MLDSLGFVVDSAMTTGEAGAILVELTRKLGFQTNATGFPTISSLRRRSKSRWVNVSLPSDVEVDDEVLSNRST